MLRSNLKRFEGGQLHVRTAVRAMTERAEGVSPVLWVEIVPGGDGVLGGKRGCTVARGQRVLLEVVVAHQLRHACDVDNAILDSITLKN